MRLVQKNLGENSIMVDMIGPYILRDTRKVYENPWISVREDEVTRPSGEDGIFGVVTMVPGSSVLPLDDDNHIYMVEEFKYGIERVSLEIVSGAIDNGETPLEAAKRELHEELSCVADEWVSLGTVHPFTTIVNSPNHIFLAKGLEFVLADQESENTLKVVKVKIEDALDMVICSDVIHAASCIAILKVARMLDI